MVKNQNRVSHHLAVRTAYVAHVTTRRFVPAKWDTLDNRLVAVQNV